jgi:DNA-binding CsgD family transcriptional regulator
MPTWTIQSYAQLRRDIVRRAATAGRVQLIKGSAGVGKTTLAAEVTAELAAEGFTVLPVIGIDELRSVPLGAMAPLLAIASSVSQLPAAERLQRLLVHLSAPARGVNYLLAVDDAPMLDELSAAAVYQLVRVYGIRCVMTAREDHPLHGPLARLLDEGFVDVVPLRGLSDESAATAVRDALGGQIEPASLGRLVRLAAGNPLFLRELTFLAQADQALERTSRGLEIDVRQLPTHLRSGISHRFSGLDADARAVIEMLAVASPLPAEHLEEPITRSLEAALLIASTAAGFVLAHPLFGEVILAELSAARAQQRRLEAAELLSGGTQSNESRYRAICLRLGSPRTLTAADLTWAAQYGDWLGDRYMSLRLSDAAVAAEPTLFALAARAFALTQLQRWAEAEECFAHMAAIAHTEEERVFAVITHGAHLNFYRSDPARAVELGQAVLARVMNPLLRSELQVHVRTWLVFAGGALSPAARLAPGGTGATVNSAVLAALVAILAGDIEGGSEAIRVGRPLVDADRASAPRAREFFDFAEIFVLVYEGLLSEARGLAMARSAEPFSDFAATYGYAHGLIELYAGNTARCIEVITVAIEGLKWLDMASLTMPARAILAAAHARAGSVVAAQVQLDSIADTMLANGNVIAQSSEARAWLLAREGRIDEAADVVASAAQTLADRGLWGIAAPTAYVAVRLGRARRVLTLLESAAVHSPGPFLSSMRAHALASQSNDPVALVEVARVLAASGQFGGATNAADEAAILFRSRRSPEEERKAGRMAADYSRKSSDFRWQQHPGDASLSLTERERTVAESAAGRETSKEIALRLGLSVRTVEVHLRNIYRKLGVSSRAELRDEL